MKEINEFREFLQTHQAAYGAWGHYVSEEINNELCDALGKGMAALFVKIPPLPRVKTIESALGKISRKGYDDPLVQMTDLVGIRFVVLLSEDMLVVNKIIEESDKWNALISKDYLLEIEVNPKIFDYQSRHYEVRPKNNFNLGDESITTDMCCEVQVRTLLQHAYAELVHDSVYKPSGDVPKSAERHIARSMALMETTDDLFCKTMGILAETSKERNDLFAFLLKYYKETVGEQYLQYDLNVNYAVLDEFKDFVNDSTPSSIYQFMDKKKYIPARIISRVSYNPLFSQPCITFVYWLACEIDSGMILERWPLPGNIGGLELVLSDLGRSASR